MFRLTILVILTCAIAGASPLAWNWDIFQPANSLLTSSVFSAPPDAVNLIADSYPSSLADVANWLPATLTLSEFHSKGADDEPAASDLVLDLSTLFGHPQIVDKHRAFGVVPAGEGSN